MAQNILYCVLNWGLGHASRSVPIVQDLISKGNNVTIASDGIASQLLKKEFPNLHHVDLPPYDIQYKYESIALNLLGQCVKILRAIKKENRVINKIVSAHNITQIISDNRFGCYHKDCHSIFITHQIRLLHPNPFIQASATRLNQSLIHKFNECWVPDFEDDDSLSGLLSHNIGLKIPLKYLGPQSRFVASCSTLEKSIVALAILSGPEPQRSILEEKIVADLAEIEGNHCIVTGKQQEDYKVGKIRFLGIRDVSELSTLIGSAKHIISRCGYSSLMDYAALGRKAILIPTPGQTEQEYLAKQQLALGNHVVLSQENIDLKKVIA